MITVADLKTHLNITFDTDDALLQTKIDAAALHLERLTGKAFLTQTLTATLDCFPAAIELPRSPVSSVTSIAYRDTDWVTQTLSTTAYFAAPLNGEKTFIHPIKGTAWPATAHLAGSVTVVFVAGYGLAAAVPKPLHEAVRQYAAHLYENREPVLVGVNASELSMGIADLVAPYRAWAF